MSAENVTPAPEAEDAVVETPAGQGSRVAEQDDAAVSEAVRRLEEEGDVAADYVEELLDIADLDGDIDIEVRDGRTYVSVVSEDHDERLDDLVGPDGDAAAGHRVLHGHGASPLLRARRPRAISVSSASSRAAHRSR